MRRKRDVYAKTLVGTSIINPKAMRIGESTRKFMLRMQDVHGTKDLEGREAQVFLEPREVAGILGSIRASDLEPQDMKPLMHMINFLEKYGEQGEVRKFPKIQEPTPETSDCAACRNGKGRHTCGLAGLQDMFRMM